MVHDGYSNLEKIGEGGMALVYRAIQNSLQRPVAIKVLLKDLGFDEEARKRFDKESFIIARLNHPNIIQVFDRGINKEDMPYFVMEYVQGTNLFALSRGRQLQHSEKIDIIVQLLKALAYAHKNNVVHRDIKPDNILIDDEGHVKVLDFGIAQFYEGEREVSERTTHGTVMGTYSYMSPEQKKSAEDVSHRSDLFSVGVLMYELFTGSLPDGHFPEPKEKNKLVNVELNQLILQCLKPAPEDRPESAESLKTRLLQISQGGHLDVDRAARAYKGITKIKSKFQLLDILREDRFGGVYLYQERKDKLKRKSGELLIIKRKLSSSSGLESTRKLAELAHDSIIDTLATSVNNQHFVIVQEYLSGGTLQDKLSNPLSWQETLRIAKDICSAILFAHKHGVVHGHLRPTNILFSDQGKAKITDFSLQDDLRDVDNAHYYALQGEERSTSADIYAVGVILYQLFTGCLPRRKNEEGFVIRKFFTKLPKEFQTVIKDMLSTLPEGRDELALPKAISLFANHLEDRDKTFFTVKPDRAPKRRSDELGALFLEEQEASLPNPPPDSNSHKTLPVALSTGLSRGLSAGLQNQHNNAANPRKPSLWQWRPQRVAVLFGLLLLVFVQYLVFSENLSGDISSDASPPLNWFNDLLNQDG